MAWIDYQVTGKPREGGAMQMLSPETASHPVWADGERLLARLLTFPLPTAAAINGHWVAWGCMLGLAFDYRVMREDRGFMFVPAVDIGAIYSTGFTELMRAKVSRNVLRDMITFAKRYSASDLVEEGVVSVSSVEIENSRRLKAFQQRERLRVGSTGSAAAGGAGRGREGRGQAVGGQGQEGGRQPEHHGRHQAKALCVPAATL